jgi:hypothetical protein
MKGVWDAKWCICDTHVQVGNGGEKQKTLRLAEGFYSEGCFLITS